MHVVEHLPLKIFKIVFLLPFFDCTFTILRVQIVSLGDFPGLVLNLVRQVLFLLPTANLAAVRSDDLVRIFVQLMQLFALHFQIVELFAEKHLRFKHVFAVIKMFMAVDVFELDPLELIPKLFQLVKTYGLSLLLPEFCLQSF